MMWFVKNIFYICRQNTAPAYRFLRKTVAKVQKIIESGVIGSIRKTGFNRYKKGCSRKTFNKS